jgi:hypothetical protein
MDEMRLSHDVGGISEFGVGLTGRAWPGIKWRTGAIVMDQSRVIILPEDENVGASKLPLSEQESGVEGAHRQPPLRVSRQPR